MTTLTYCFRAAEWTKWHLVSHGNLESTHAECGVSLDYQVEPVLIDESYSGICRRCLRVVGGLTWNTRDPNGGDAITDRP